jgi:DNA-binding PadR family transcriptional regulator
MKPSTPWSRHSRHHHIPTPGAVPEDRLHHPRSHPGHAFSDSPRADGGGRRHHPPFGGGPGGRPGGPFGGGPEGPFGGGPRGGRRGGRHGRAGRGDVRSALLLLLADEPMHGYQLMQAVAERTGGAWKLSPGAVYPTIAQLEDEGLVRISAEGGRKLVTLTDAGREHLTALGDVDPFATFAAEEGRPDLRALLGELMGAAHQLGRVGDAAQLTEAARVLSDARRALYLILAGRPDAPTPADEQGDSPA